MVVHLEDPEAGSKGLLRCGNVGLDYGMARSGYALS